jgi:hypothetical protein
MVNFTVVLVKSTCLLLNSMVFCWLDQFFWAIAQQFCSQHFGEIDHRSADPRPFGCRLELSAA